MFRFIDFNQINDDIVKHLVMARISQPSSMDVKVESIK